MKRFAAILLSGLMLMSLAVSCARDGRIIPRKTFAKIYADMLKADQWLVDNYDERKVADTCLFYEPIFAKYGYTSADYHASVKHYLEDTEDYKKILDMASVELMKEIDSIKEQKGEKEVEPLIEKETE